MQRGSWWESSHSNAEMLATLTSRNSRSYLFLRFASTSSLPLIGVLPASMHTTIVPVISSVTSTARSRRRRAVVEVIDDPLLTLLLQPLANGVDHLLALVQRDLIHPIGAKDLLEVTPAALVRLAADEQGQMVGAGGRLPATDSQLLIQSRQTCTPAGGVVAAPDRHRSVQPVYRPRSIPLEAVPTPI